LFPILVTLYINYSIYYNNLTHVFVYFVKILKIAKRLRTTVPSPLYNVKELKLIVNDKPTRKIHEVVDVLLWICPLLEILVVEWRYLETPDNISFKVLYDAFFQHYFQFLSDN
jgi:hypothetical protein